MTKRIVVVPNRRIGSMFLKKEAQKPETVYYNPAYQEYKTETVHCILVTNVDQIRGCVFDEIYFHPAVEHSKKLPFLLQRSIREAKYVIRLEDLKVDSER